MGQYMASSRPQGCGVCWVREEGRLPQTEGTHVCTQPARETDQYEAGSRGDNHWVQREILSLGRVGKGWDHHSDLE